MTKTAYSGPVAPQVFIVGPPRCGTSITMAAVRRALPGHRSFDEGHFIDILPHVRHAVSFLDQRAAPHRGVAAMTMAAQANFHELERHILDVVRSHYEHLQGSPFFIEKTPGADMVYALTTLKRWYPSAKAIFLKRRAIEYMRSATRKFPDNSWDLNLKHWVDAMNAYSELRYDLGDFIIDIDQFDIAFNRESAARAMADHLNIGDDGANVLLDTFSSLEIEKTPNTSYNAIDVADLEMDRTRREEFLEKTAATFESYGYSYGTQYYSQ